MDEEFVEVTSVAIIHSSEIWAAGIASLVRTSGFALRGHWSKLDAAFAALTDSEPGIFLVSWRLLEKLPKPQTSHLPRHLSVIIVLEPDEALSAEDLRQCAFEGVLISDAPARVVETCIRTVAEGRAWIDPTFLRWTSRRSNLADWNCLSDRELEVANLAASGLSNKRIARALHLSDGTVKMHMHHILAKLHLERRGELVLSLMRDGGIPNGRVSQRPGSAAKSSARLKRASSTPAAAVIETDFTEAAL